MLRQGGCVWRSWIFLGAPVPLWGALMQILTGAWEDAEQGNLRDLTGETGSTPMSTPTQASWHLAPTGATQCDSGVGASQSQCESAVAQLAKTGKGRPGRTLQTGKGGSCKDGSWGNVPLGCSAQTGGDWAAHYKTSGVNCPNSVYQLVCSGNPSA